FTGQLVFLTDVTRLQVWNGSAWTFITNGAPGAPTSLSATALSTTSVSVAFTTGTINGASPINYKYSLSTNGGSTYGEPIALDPADAVSPVTISGLTGGQTYHIKLRAVSDFGDSPDSTATSIAVPTVPSAPTSLSATPGTTTVSISFTPGADGGSAITNYQYATSTNGGSTYSSFTALNPEDSTSPITITGLTEGIAYLVKLKAVSAFGAGAESAAVSFTQGFAIDYLVVGGGGGGSGIGGGGGGGGLLSSLSQGAGASGVTGTAVTGIKNTNYSVVVGAGGAGKTYGSAGFFVAGSSTFSSFTARGGSSGVGQVASSDVTQYASGGGGNGGYGSAGLTADPLYGYSGSNGGGSGGGYWGGGGGGAGSAGLNGSSGQGGAAGVGRANSITGSSVLYAPGGGGYGGDTGG
ncbi:fibronectin type III domain-containing protein, partial [bacterium]|nr:fibronectin type III domain-containing protein [bacterium]